VRLRDLFENGHRKVARPSWPRGVYLELIEVDGYMNPWVVFRDESISKTKEMLHAEADLLDYEPYPRKAHAPPDDVF
jgi:hypothetical protein